MIGREGMRTAADGWWIGWSLDDPLGAFIDVGNEQGVLQYSISGEITLEYVQQEMDRVLSEHSGQMEMRL